MSQFSEMFQSAFVPALMHWHGDPMRIKNFGDDNFVEISKALIRDEVRDERRDGEYELEIVTIRHVQIVTDADHEDFSGLTDVKVDSIAEIGGSRYLVEVVSRGDHGMQRLQLIRQGRSKLGSREAIGE
jgi:hypothetical protein